MGPEGPGRCSAAACARRVAEEEGSLDPAPLALPGPGGSSQTRKEEREVEGQGRADQDVVIKGRLRVMKALGFEFGRLPRYRLICKKNHKEKSPREDDEL